MNADRVVIETRREPLGPWYVDAEADVETDGQVTVRPRVRWCFEGAAREMLADEAEVFRWMCWDAIRVRRYPDGAVLAMRAIRGVQRKGRW